MSTRTALRPHTVLAAGDMSGNLTSEPTILQSLTKVSYQLSWSGASPDGDISIQVSNDYAIGPGSAVLNPGTWSTIPLTDNTGAVVLSLPVTGNTGDAYVDVTTAAYAIRAVYESDSGTGNLTIVVTGKVA